MTAEVSRVWRLRKQRYNLEGEICPHCEAPIFPPRDVCPTCHKDAKVPHKFSPEGEVYSFTTVRNAPEGFEAPYVVALVKLKEGPIVTTQITDLDPNRDLDSQVYIGMQVRGVIRKLKEQGKNGIIEYGMKFTPISPDMNTPEPVPDLELTSVR